jgi:hypothetical protein
MGDGEGVGITVVRIELESGGRAFERAVDAGVSDTAAQPASSIKQKTPQ